MGPGCCPLMPPWPPGPCCCRVSANKLVLPPIPWFPKPILGEPFITWFPIMPGCCCPLLPFCCVPIMALFMPPIIPAAAFCCIMLACCWGERCCCCPWPIIWGGGCPGDAFIFAKCCPMCAAPPGLPMAPWCPCWAEVGGPERKSSDSCLCLATASWLPGPPPGPSPRPIAPTPPLPPPGPSTAGPGPSASCNWLRSPPLTSPGSFELISSSGRSHSSCKNEPNSGKGGRKSNFKKAKFQPGKREQGPLPH